MLLIYQLNNLLAPVYRNMIHGDSDDVKPKKKLKNKRKDLEDLIKLVYADVMGEAPTKKFIAEIANKTNILNEQQVKYAIQQLLDEDEIIMLMMGL